MKPVLVVFDVFYRFPADNPDAGLEIQRVLTYAAELAVEIVEMYGHQVVGVVQV